MSINTPDAFTTGIESLSMANVDTSENADVTISEERQRELGWHEVLDNQRIAMGDAEETCVLFFDDLLTAMFQVMKVRAENAALFALSAQQLCAQVFEGVNMSTLQASNSLNRISGPSQVLKPQRKWAQSPLPCSIMASLRRLLTFLESHRVIVELQRFPLSEVFPALFDTCTCIESFDGRSGRHEGEWCILAAHVQVFLKTLVSKGFVSIVPSTIAVIMATNRDSVEKMLHERMHVTLRHLRHFVQKTLERVKEKEKHVGGNQTLVLLSSCKELSDKAETESTVQLQTQVAFQEALHDAERVRKHEMSARRVLLSSYVEESPPRAIEIDCHAPGQVNTKAAISASSLSKRAIARQTILRMAPPPRHGSRWATVQQNVFVSCTDNAKSNGGMAITADADTKVSLASDKHLSTTIPKALVDKGATGPQMETRVATIPKDENNLNIASPLNVFSLETPRQLLGHEVAWKNDLLAQLKREADDLRRRASTTVGASTDLSEKGDRKKSAPFQAEPDSIIMLGMESNGSSKSGQSDQAAAPRSRGRRIVAHSKFELEREPLSFSVSDVNVHEEEWLAVAMCSPIKQIRGPSRPPETSERTAPMIAQLPRLDSSRLAIGVSAVVHGVEKFGPRRNPSRNTRLRLHNYSVRACSCLDDESKSMSDMCLCRIVQPPFDGKVGHKVEETNGGSHIPFSPVRSRGPSCIAPCVLAMSEAEESYRLPIIPVVSPIRARPYPRHVVLKGQNHADKEREAASISLTSYVRQRLSAKMKQPVWEAKTRAPPRTRNRHFASGRNFCKIQRYGDENDKGASSVRCQEQEGQRFNSMMAPRRDDFSSVSEFD